MKFDYYVLNSHVPAADGDGPDLYAKWFEQISLAEELGLHCAWFTEHHFRAFGGMLPSPPMLMSALAQRTERIRLGTAVVILPLHHPLQVAEELAMLDILSGGRLEVGVGRGMGSQYYDVFGADPETAQEKFEEQVAMLQGAWTDSEFRWNGRYYQCPQPITVLPRPLQQPHPPLWIPASTNPVHCRWIGHQGVNLMTLPWRLPNFEPTRLMIDEWRAGLREAGRAEAGLEVLAYFPTYVGETMEQVQRDVEGCWTTWQEISAAARGAPGPDGPTYDLLVESSRAIFGDPARCRQHIERIQSELGLDRIALLCHFGGLPQEKVLASMRLFAREVAPAFAE